MSLWWFFISLVAFFVFDDLTVDVVVGINRIVYHHC